MTQGSITIAGGFWIALAIFGHCTAAETVPITAGNKAPSTRAANQAGPQPLFVVNISERFLTDMLREPVTEHTPVSGAIVGNPVRGTARTYGRVYLDCVQSSHEARFWLLFAGETTAQSIAYRDPARIHSTTLTKFVTGKEFTYDNDGQLRRQPVRVIADTDRYTRCIESLLPGLRGTFVRRVAANRLEQYSGAISRDANLLARNQVAESFERHVQKHMNNLEQRMESIRETFQESARQREHEWRIGTSDQGVLISAYARDQVDQLNPSQHVENLLPSLARSDSLVEVWQHDQWSATDAHSLNRSSRVLRFVLRVFAGTTELPSQWEENIRRIGNLDSSVAIGEEWQVVQLYDRE